MRTTIHFPYRPQRVLPLLAVLAALLSATPLCSHSANPQLLTSSLSFRQFTTQDGLPQMQTETVWQDSRGYIYIGTLSGFVRYDGRQFEPFLKGRRINIVDFQELDGRVYAFGFRRYWDFNPVRPSLTLHQIDPANERTLNNFNASDLPAGHLLTEDADEQQRKLYRLTTDGLSPLLSHPVLDEMTPDRKLYIDSTGTYVPTPTGLYRIDPQGQAHRLTEQADVYSLCRWDGRLWAFAETGAFAIDGRESCLSNTESGPSQLTVGNLACQIPNPGFAIPYSGMATDYGLLVRTTHNGELLIADAHSLYAVTRDHTLRQIATGFNLIKDLFIDRWDRLWLATYQGVYCFFNRRFTNHRLNDPNDIVRAIAALPDGRMVMGTLNGKLIVGDSIVSDAPDNFFVPSASVVGGNAFMACRDDVAEIWINKGKEVALWWRHLPYNRYQFVGEYGDEVLLGTRQMILAYDPLHRNIDTLTTDIPHPWCAVADDDGNLWVGSTYGLFRLTPQLSTLNCQLSTPEKVEYRDQRLIVTTMARDSRGTVYFASGDSLLKVIYGEVWQVSDSLNSRLAGHEIRQLHVSPRGYLVIAVIDGLFIVRLTADGQTAATAFFDHRNGFTMIEPQQARMAETPDGTVWMPCLDGMVSFRPEELLADSQADTFIAPPVAWWQHWWVIAAAVLAMVGIAVGLALLAERRHHRRRLRRLEREKKQKELQINAIRLKAIPHFHANVLAGIEYFLMNNDSAEATHYLKLYSDFTNQTLTDIDRPARSVAEEVAYTRIYLELEQLRYGDRLNFDIRVADDVNQQRQLPTMLLHTYSQNAVKHGIGNKVGGGHIAIDISRRPDGYLTVRVTDDGVGRAAAAQLNSNSTRQGLRILLEQIELYNQSNRRPISQTVTDLYDADGRPAGTCFEMDVPEDYNY